MQRGRELIDDDYIAVQVVLIHRSDNTYNSNAISVSMPSSLGGDLDRRHLGYLHDSYLRAVGMTNLPDLAADKSNQIVCTGILRAGPDLRLDLPRGWVIAKAIRDFLSPNTDVSAPLQRHTQPSEKTAESLSQMRTFNSPKRSIESLSIALSARNRNRPRSLQISAVDSGRFMGTVAMGYLFLEDERDRPATLAHLTEAGIPVAQPISDPFHVRDDEWPSSTLPNIWTYWFVDRLEFRSRDSSTTPSWNSIAYYNHTTRKLWVEDSRMAAPACIYAARVGIRVADVGVPRTPWSLQTEIPYHELMDPLLRPKKQEDPDVMEGLRADLFEHLRGLVPEEVLPGGFVRWISSPSVAQNHEPDPVFILNEQHVQPRRTLFSDQRLSSTIAACRLCGQRGLEFTSPICVDPLTYCQACLNNATRGIVRASLQGSGNARACAATALRLLGTYEFDQAPMLESQLDTLHLNPAEPVSGSDIDRLLLLRFAILRQQYPWTHLLEQAGFAESGLRSSRGTLVRARDGHLCLSLREKMVCDFLHQHEVKHGREPHYPIDADFNPSGRRRADWILADGTLVELWGMPKDPVYAAKMEQKRKLAARYGLALVELTDAELPRLPEVFAPWLPPSSARATSWRWSPIVVRPVRVKKELKKDGGAVVGGRGRNEFNADVRQERLERCRKAVSMQQAGLSRHAIGLKLGIGQGSVKTLLRDGRFYADTDTDPARFRAARTAADAQRQGRTRKQFQTEYRLSIVKAHEAWRDADVLFGAGDA